jgi:hypothetical protein
VSEKCLGSEKRSYFKAIHIFKGAKLWYAQLYHRRRGDNGRNVSRQDGLVLRLLFRRKPAHLICETDMEAEGCVILGTKSKYFRSEPVSQGAELGTLAIIGRRNM